MSTETPALSHYSRVIQTKRAGTCRTCGKATVPGRDYAAVNGHGAWSAFCGACAASWSSQVAGLIAQAEALATTASPDTLAALALPVEADIAAALAGSAGNAASYEVVRSLLMAVDALTSAAHAQATAADPLLDSLRAIAASATASPRDREFATSLVAGAERYGHLTDRQREAAERMVAKGSTKPSNRPAPGVYVNAGGVFVKVQANKAGTGVYAKVWTGSGWDYQPAAIGDTSLRPITADEAAAFGHQHGACMFCSRSLTDDGPARSVQVGYGPVCAKRHGLPWGEVN